MTYQVGGGGEQTLERWAISADDTDMHAYAADLPELMSSEEVTFRFEALTAGSHWAGTLRFDDVQVEIQSVQESNQAPQFTSDPADSATGHHAYSYKLAAADADGDEISFSLTEAPGWLTLGDRGDGTAILTGTPDSTAVGTHTVTVSVSDGFDTSTQTFSVRVYPNRLPSTVAVTTPAPGDTVSIAGDGDANLTVEWPASRDPEGEMISYTWEISSESTFASTWLSRTVDTPGLTLTYDKLASLLTRRGVREGSTVDLYQRIESRDPHGGTYGDTTGIILIRGKITGLMAGEKGPTRYALFNNYPNPFNPTTTIPFTLPEPSHVRLTLHNILGERIRILVDQSLPAGRHDLRLSAGSLATGTYSVRLGAAEHVEFRPIILVE